METELKPMEVISSHLLSEIEEAFGSISSSRDATGYLNGKSLLLALRSLGLEIDDVKCATYNNVDIDHRIQYVQFVNLVHDCMKSNGSWISNEIKESFQHFSSHNSDGLAEEGEMRLWLNQLGEHVDGRDTMLQIEMHKDKDASTSSSCTNTMDTMSLSEYTSMIENTNEIVMEKVEKKEV